MSQSLLVVRDPRSPVNEEVSSFVQTVANLVEVLGDSYRSLDENGFSCRSSPIAVQNFVMGNFSFFQTASGLSIYFQPKASNMNLLLEADRLTGTITFLRSGFDLHEVRLFLVETLRLMGGDYAAFAQRF